MRKTKILNYVTILLLIFLTNCEGHSDELQLENENSLSKSLKVNNKSAFAKDASVIYGVIFTDEHCIGGRKYKYYATSTDVVPYDRHVYSIAKRGDATIILPLRIIPANQNISEAIRVFGNENVKLENISLQAQQVFSNGVDISANFERPFIDMYIDNCTRPQIYPPDNPCDIDANDNGTPDCFE